MSDSLDNMNEGTAQRPTFLTVLCILTFIGSGLGVLGGILALVGSSALGMFSPQGSLVSAAVGLVAAGLCLFGAVKMWGLYKQGFTLYLAGSVLSLVGGLVGIFTFKMPQMEDLGGEFSEFTSSTNQLAEGLAKSAMWTGFIFSLVIVLVFVLMYNANRKHLVK
jgi:hypothetical protein